MIEIEEISSSEKAGEKELKEQIERRNKIDDGVDRMTSKINHEFATVGITKGLLKKEEMQYASEVRIACAVGEVAKQVRRAGRHTTESLNKTIIPINLDDYDIREFAGLNSDEEKSLPGYIAYGIEKSDSKDPEKAKRQTIDLGHGVTREFIPSAVTDMTLAITRNPNDRGIKMELVGDSIVNAELLAQTYKEAESQPREKEKPISSISIEDEAKARVDILMALRHADMSEPSSPPDRQRNPDAYWKWYTERSGEQTAWNNEYSELYKKEMEKIKEERKRK